MHLKSKLLGAMKAIEAFPDIEIILVGNETKIRPFLTNDQRITILHTEEEILSTDEPVRAVRRKKTASMVLAAQQVADGEGGCLYFCWKYRGFNGIWTFCCGSH